ncbi:F-box domain containing protein [Melia azedarach]|uniref:F-box domain containing protein n=1 Tax=Melia azedarach TaxID=155640 RepID=A0ACC1X025_MELAZ|nr:F-box domain containing protein [Melia azedarach]
MDEELPEIKRCKSKVPAMMSKTKMKEKVLTNEDAGEHSPPYLSEEIIFQVLTRLPATYLHDKVRYICKPWHNLISSTGFIAKNTQQNKRELLVLVPCTTNTKLSYEVKLLEMDDKTIDFNLTNVPLPRMGDIIRSSCNGLILVNDPKHSQSLCVMNMLTKSSLTLPQCPSYCPHEKCGAAIGFDPSAKVYKVVHIYADRFGFEIFTLGVSDNAWKSMPGPFRSSNEPPFIIHTFEWSDPVCINGQVFHWNVDSNSYIVSMDVSDEIPRKTFLPVHHSRNIHRFNFLEMGGKLALLYHVSSIQIDVWILEDFPGQNWIKTHSILAESIKYTMNSCCLPDFLKLFAVAALRDGEVLIFRHRNNNYTSVHCYLYDIRQRELKKKKNMIMKEGSKFIHHRSSLIQWKNEEVEAKRLAISTSP